MTDTTTEAVERLMKNVTPGPWTVGADMVITAPDVDCPSEPWGVAGVSAICGWPAKADANAAFIAASRDLVPALLAERDAMKAQLAASQTPDPVTNADSCQPMRTYEDGVRDAAAVALSLGRKPTHTDELFGIKSAKNLVKPEQVCCEILDLIKTSATKAPSAWQNCCIDCRQPIGAQHQQWCPWEGEVSAMKTLGG